MRPEAAKGPVAAAQPSPSPSRVATGLSGRVSSRVSTPIVLAILGLLAAMAATTAWAAARTQGELDGVRRAVALADAYDSARFAAISGSELGLQLLLETDPDERANLAAEIQANIAAASTAFLFIRSSGDASDRAVVSDLLKSYGPATTAATTYLGSAAGPEGAGPPKPSTAPLVETLSQKADERSAVALRSLEAYAASTRRIAVITLGIDAVCIVGSIFLGFTLRSSVRREARAESLRRQAERESVERSERRFRSLVQNATDLIAIADGSGDLRYVSPSAATVLGMTADEAAGMQLLDLFRADDRERIARLFSRIARRPGTLAPLLVTRLRHADGHWVDVEVITHNLLDDADIRGIVFNIRDISERVAAASEREQLASVIESTSDIVVVVDAHANVLQLNRAARAFLGIRASQPASTVRLVDLVSPAALEALRSQALPVATAHGSWAGELSAVLPGVAGGVLEVELIAHRGAGRELEYLSFLARDVSQRREFEAQLVHLANCDSLTGMFNRRRFEQELELELERLGRAGGCSALLFLDLDNFKSINDGLGHSAGDALVRALAGAVRAVLPEGAVAARIGGDEFAALIPGADASRALEVGEEVRTAVRDHRLILEGRSVSTTASIGVVLLPDNGSNVDRLMANVDLAMYEAKRNRDSCCLYTDASDRRTELSEQLEWEQRLRNALVEDEFVIVAQPICSVAGEVVGRELLLRLRQPDGSLLAPAGFLSVAERSGLITEIDRWVLARALEFIADASASGHPIRLSVNLSGRTLRVPDLPAEIISRMEAARIDPGALTLEITETAAISDLEEARRFIAPLREFGVRFAVDDFGAGYASFTYLKHLPVDYVKIDGSFIRNLPRESDNRHLVRAIVEVARGLGKSTLAEFVEDEETLRVVRELGVDFAQGYYLGRPAGLADAPSGVATERRAA